MQHPMRSSTNFYPRRKYPKTLRVFLYKVAGFQVFWGFRACNETWAQIKARYLNELTSLGLSLIKYCSFLQQTFKNAQSIRPFPKRSTFTRLKTRYGGSVKLTLKAKK